MSGLWEVARETLRFLSSREELADLCKRISLAPHHGGSRA